MSGPNVTYLLLHPWSKMSLCFRVSRVSLGNLVSTLLDLKCRERGGWSERTRFGEEMRNGTMRVGTG